MSVKTAGGKFMGLSSYPLDIALHPSLFVSLARCSWLFAFPPGQQPTIPRIGFWT